MSLTQVLAAAKKAGVSFYLEDGKLAFKAPKGAFSASLKSQVIAVKTELVDFLKRAEEAHSGPKVLNVDHAPVSIQQQNQFTLYSRNPESAAYHISLPIKISHAVSAEQLHESLHRLFSKHEAFSTYFEINEHGVEQFVRTPSQWPIFEDENVSNLNLWAKTAFNTPFNLENQLAFRVHITQDEQCNHLVLLVVHHIVFDGWSVGLLAKDFEQCLLSVIEGKERELPTAARLTYLDFSAWQFSEEGAQRLSQGINFWKLHLDAAPQYHELPTLANTSSVQGARHERVLRKEISEQIEVLARRFAVTPFVVYHSIFSLVLGRFSNQQDVVVGTPVANRMWPQVESIIGNFVNTIALRTQWRADDKFSDLLERRKAQYQSEMAQQSVPFEEVVRALDITQENGNPLFQVMFSFQNDIGVEKTSDLISSVPFSLEIQTSKFDLQLDVSVANSSYLFSWQYNQNKLRQELISAMWESFENALEKIIDNAEVGISDLMKMPQSQLEQWQTWNNTDTAFPSLTMTELFTHHAHAPEAIALSDDTQRINYSAFYQRSCQWGHLLQEYGVAPEKLVALYLPRSVEMVLALHGVWQAGGAYLPLDISHPAQRITDILEDAQPQCVITTRELANNLPEHVEIICLDEQSTLDALAQQDKKSPQVTRSASDLAYVIYTSGSTGMPKGVMIEHKALVNRIDWMQRQYPITPTDVVVQKTPYTFDVSVWELVWPFYVGAELTVAKEQGHKDPQYLSEFMAKQNVSVMHFVPSMLSAMLQHGDLAQVASLKYVFASGEALPSQVVKAFYKAVNSGSLHNLYGPTEAAIDVSYWDCSAADDIVPIGRPIQNIQLHVLDEDLKSLPIGAVGELYISGVGLARGYLNRAELTAERFISSPTNAQEKLYKTGDLVYWREDGQLVYIGRSDFQVKLRGLRIELGEIEAQLLDVAGITEAAVVVQEEQLVAYVVGETNTDAIKAQLAIQLPSYMVPEHYVELEKMPLSANGKLARNALAPISFATSSDVYEAPVGEIEQKVSEIWQQVLRVEQIGRNDQFFKLGGDSISVLKVVSQLRLQGLHLPLEKAYEKLVLKDLAAELESNAGQTELAAVTGHQALSPLAIWYRAFSGDAFNHFYQSASIKLPTEATTESVATMVGNMLERHDALRLTLADDIHLAQYQEFSQNLLDSVYVPVVDDCADEHAWHETIRTVCTEIKSQWSLTQQCAAKFIHFKNEALNEQVLVMVVHHIAVDAVSWLVLLQDIEAEMTGLPVSIRTVNYQQFFDIAQSQSVADNIARLEFNDKDVLRWEEKQRIAQSLDLSDKLMTLEGLDVEFNQVLTAATLLAYQAITDRAQIEFDIEGHGRDSHATIKDAATVMGWFTDVAVTKLKRSENSATQNSLSALYALEASSTIENRFNGDYWQHNSQVSVERDVQFNFFGKVSESSNDDTIEGAAFDTGPDISAQFPFLYNLVFSSKLSNKALKVTADFNPNHLEREQVAQLITSLPSFIEQVIAALAEHSELWPQLQLQAKANLPVEQSLIFSGRTTYLPTSLMQKSMYLDSVAHEGQGKYVTQMTLTFKGQLDVSRLQTAVSKVLSKYPSLRAQFTLSDTGELYQSIAVSALPKVVYEHTERTSAKHEFNLNEELMLMMRVENMPDNTANLYLTHHHIILDGWSLGIFVKEVVAAYELSDTYQFEQQSQLPYFNWLAQTSTYQARQYWQSQLSQLEAPTLLANNQAQAALAESRLVLSKAQTAKVTDFCKHQGVSINNLLQAVWGFALSKVSNQSTVCFGQVVNGRSPELANSNDMVGLFINTLPKVVACDAQSSISDFVRRIHDPEQLNAETLPFTEISKCAPHIAGPLFDSLFVFENFPIEVGDSEKASEDLELVAIEGEESTGFPITFLAVPGDALICKLQLKADIGLSAEALLTLVEHILMEFVSCTNLSDVNALPVEQSQQLQTWNNTVRAFPSSTMTELFTHHAHAPEAIALSDDTQRINYSAFYQRSCQWGHLLQGYGVAPEKLVALYLPRSVEMVFALHGVWQAGGAYLPLDISHPAQRIADILEDAQPQCVITTRELAGNLPAHIEVICLNEQSTLDALAQQEKNSPEVTRSASDLAYVIYTSGSTGMPKGVMVEHKALVNRIDWMQRQYPMTPTDVVVQKTPYTFDVSVWELVWPFYVGAELTVAKEQGHKDPQYLSEFMAQQNVSVMHFVPSMLSAMLQHGDLAQVTSLKYVFASGEALPSQVVTAFYQTVKTGSLHNLYGPTEAAIDVSYWDCSSADDIVPIGRPIQNIQLHVLDEDLKSLPIGAVGELYISGVGLARGYLNRAELTTERFISSPTNAQEKLYKTGDLVYWREDGQLVYIGRTDFQVKLRGLRIELGEIEAQLLDVVGITEAAVVVQEEQLVAYVVGETNTDAVKKQLAAQLPNFMVPEHYVVLEKMPLSANGKLARNALAPISFTTPNDVYEAPVGEIEQHIARVWQEVLKLEKVGRYDDFYRLGGHSLLALNVLGQLQRALNIQIPLATVIEFSELKTLAAQIERLNTHVVALHKADENQKVPLTKAQQRMWLVQQLSPQSSEFNMFSALTLRGEINVERIETALRKVQTYHGALRTHLVEQAGEVWQQQMSADLSLTVLDGSLDKAHTMAQVKSLVSQPLSLLNSSPVKVFLLRQSSTQACLVFVVHHMFSDGLSMALIAESFEHFYHAEHSQLVEAPFHYSDYALTQSQDERTYDQALAWWREYLKDAPEHHGLMLANPRTAKVSASGNTLTKVLGGSTYQKLSELTSELGISVFHLMHGLISQVVAQYSSDKDVVIGSPMANRVHPDVENMVGLFLDTFVVRHQIDTACSVSQWLKATAENCKEAMRHGQVGFEQIVSELNPNRGHHSPIFQIFINHLKQKEVERDDTKRDFEISQFELPLEQAKYEVSFYVIEGSNGLELGLNYKQDLIEQASAQAYLDALVSLIDRVLIDSSQPMSTVLHPSEADCAADKGDAVNLNHQNLYDWFSASASEFAHKQALTDELGSVTYQQLDAQVNVIATSLKSRESVAQRVLVYGKRNSAFIGAILACWKIGATAVPIDSDTPIQRAEYIYQDSEADFVLINDATCDFVPSEKQIHLADILSTHSQQASGESALALQGNAGSSNQVAYLVYTSGSTGKPKGVCGTHTGLINRLQWMHNTYPFASENNVQITQSGFIRTLWETFLPLMRGNHVHILASDYYQDPESFFKTLNALQVDRIVTTPTVVQSFSQYAKQAGAVLPKLKYWFASGEAMSPEIANEALSSFDDIQFVNLYGSTEVTSDVTHFPLDNNATYQSMRVGQAIANTSVYVVDEQNNKLPALAKGQVAIAGASLAEGYWQRADDSQRAFVQLNGSAERAYLTGDYGVIDQTGQLQLLGRKDDLVNLGGYRCELKEIERAIQRLEHVEDACVIVKEGDTPYLAAYVASRFLSGLATQQLTDFLLNAKKELNLWLPYYMLPKSIQVVSKFPVTANGKLDKKALLALSVSSLVEPIEATTEVELLVSKVTVELLNLDKVDLARNFFELGGTSIQAAQLRNSIMSELEINLPLATVFNAVSLQSLTQEIEQQMKSQNLMEHLLSSEEDEADEEFII